MHSVVTCQYPYFTLSQRPIGIVLSAVRASVVCPTPGYLHGVSAPPSPIALQHCAACTGIRKLEYRIHLLQTYLLSPESTKDTLRVWIAWGL